MERVKRNFFIRLERKRCSFQSRQNQGLTLAVMSDEIAFDLQNKKLGGTELLSLAREYRRSTSFLFGGDRLKVMDRLLLEQRASKTLHRID